MLLRVFGHLECCLFEIHNVCSTRLQAFVHQNQYRTADANTRTTFTIHLLSTRPSERGVYSMGCLSMRVPPMTWALGRAFPFRQPQSWGPPRPCQGMDKHWLDVALTFFVRGKDLRTGYLFATIIGIWTSRDTCRSRSHLTLNSARCESRILRCSGG